MTYDSDTDEDGDFRDAFDRLFLIKEDMSPVEIEESRRNLGLIRSRVHAVCGGCTHNERLERKVRLPNEDFMLAEGNQMSSKRKLPDASSMEDSRDGHLLELKRQNVSNHDASQNDSDKDEDCEEQ